jgi:general nucleoside transport system ATP-binding protein
MAEALAEARSVEKRFGAIIAVRSMSAAFQAGEIHAVCGENGAGKSTLLKLVAGMLVPDAGTVMAFGSELQPHTAREAIDRGIAMVLQHFALVPVMTSLENIILGAEPHHTGGVLDFKAARARAEKIAKDLDTNLHLDERVESLGVGDKQRIEIARALFRDAKLVILDEPTAVLTKTEATALYTTLRTLAKAGKGIVVVTHKMDEVRAHADIVTVMRRGEHVFTKKLDRSGDVAAQVEEVTQAIMGAGATGYREQSPERRGDSSKKKEESGAVVLTMKNVSVGRGLVEASLSVRAGEIVGIAGVEGNGQKELVSVLAGDEEASSGSIEGGPFAFIREDRHHEGLVLDASLRDNIVLGELDRFAGVAGLLDLGRLEKEATKRIELSGAPKDLDRPARTLSGGNQQKIVIARVLARKAKVIVAAQPTRGVDLGASTGIHAQLRDAASKDGCGIIVISADLDELRKLSTNRILVLARGKIVAELPHTATDDEIGRHMLGIAS